MGPTWVLSAPDGPHVGPMKLAIRINIKYYIGKLFIKLYLFWILHLYIWNRRQFSNNTCGFEKQLAHENIFLYIFLTLRISLLLYSLIGITLLKIKWTLVPFNVSYTLKMLSSTNFHHILCPKQMAPETVLSFTRLCLMYCVSQDSYRGQQIYIYIYHFHTTNR